MKILLKLMFWPLTLIKVLLFDIPFGNKRRSA